MWHERCSHCDRNQLFGVRRVLGIENGPTGSMALRWSCPRCGRANRLTTGRDAAADST